MNFGGPQESGYPFASLLTAVAKIQPQWIEAPEDLLNQHIPGDWVIRPGQPADQIVKQLETVLRDELSMPIRMEFREVQRAVYVARGVYHLNRLPDAPQRSNANSIEIFGQQLVPESGAGGGNGKFGEFLDAVGRWIATPIVAEVASPPAVDLTWYWHARSPYTQQMHDEDHDPKQVLSPTLRLRPD